MTTPLHKKVFVSCVGSQDIHHLAVLQRVQETPFFRVQVSNCCCIVVVLLLFILCCCCFVVLHCAIKLSLPPLPPSTPSLPPLPPSTPPSLPPSLPPPPPSTPSLPPSLRCETCGFRYHPRCSYKVPTTCSYLDDDILYARYVSTCSVHYTVDPHYLDLMNSVYKPPF